MGLAELYERELRACKSNCVTAHVGVIHLFERVHDIPRTQALGVEGEDLVVHLGQVGLALADELRLEGGVTVARRLDGDLSVLAF